MPALALVATVLSMLTIIEQDYCGDKMEETVVSMELEAMEDIWADYSEWNYVGPRANGDMVFERKTCE
ncbi:hypothetical protein FLK61_28945 [Paenalkalicoccus suaedae]|uniref:Uncharacterized protein n=1 Tax=Paenalkalicoccus suaedae TaxID=2592382 RepID=A0A859FDW2_9BACI|nr:hypothetical protein [Paenalkalicoccus suaedae]QKS70764.1 hypothetical protein FLK61_28945 [Paenalkalicoccus suaedae]